MAIQGFRKLRTIRRNRIENSKLSEEIKYQEVFLKKVIRAAMGLN